MEKEYYLDIDVTVSVQMYVTADNVEQAKDIAKNNLMKETCHHISKGYYVDSIITTIEEC